MEKKCNCKQEHAAKVQKNISTMVEKKQMNGFEIVNEVAAKFMALDEFVSRDFQTMRGTKFTSDDFKDGTFRLYRLATELKLAMDELEILHPDIY